MIKEIEVEEERLIFQDYILFIIIFLCTYFNWGVWSTVTSFLPLLKLMGAPLLCFILSLYLFSHSLMRNYRTLYQPLHLLIIIASFWTFFKLFQTIQVTGFNAAFTVYRRNYIVLPSFLLCMPYISAMSIQRLEKFAGLILKWIIPLTILYVLQCCGVPLFSSNITYQTSGDVTVLRNILGMPPVLPVILAFCFVCYLKLHEKRFLKFVLIALFVTFISFTRSLIASAAFVVTLAMLFYIWKNGIHSRLFMLVFYVLLATMLLMIIYPSAFYFWDNLIDNTLNSQLAKNQGTYAFRQRLIENVIIKLENHDDILTALGYVRDVAKGKYSFVLGGDTYIAPILWCEGFIGLTLRCLPFVYLLWSGFKLYSHSLDEMEEVIGIVILACVLSEIPNYVQSSVIMHYNHVMAMLYMLLVYAYKRRNEFD